MQASSTAFYHVSADMRHATVHKKVAVWFLCRTSCSLFQFDTSIKGLQFVVDICTRNGSKCINKTQTSPVNTPHLYCYTQNAEIQAVSPFQKINYILLSALCCKIETNAIETQCYFSKDDCTLIINLKHVQLLRDFQKIIYEIIQHID